MSSLVADFIINPVARTVRRLSTPFATAADTDSVRRFSHDFDLDHGDAVAECDGPSASFPSLSFLRSPDIALGARSPPLLVPQRRWPVPPTDGDTSLGSTPRSTSPAIFEMERPLTSPEPEDAVVSEPETPPPQDASDSSAAAAARKSRALPADDGMNDMRRKIQAIQSSSITFDQKRYLMQQVLTESYAKARHAKAILEGVQPPRPRPDFQPSAAVASSSSRDVGFGISALETLKSWTGLDEEQTPIHSTAEDARPTYRPKMPLLQPSELPAGAEEDVQSDDEDLPELGCAHYKRNVKVQCAECDKWYTCRLCHDDAEEHILPRKHTKNMLCMLCGHAQKASDTCAHCGESAASYYCNICKLWSDDVNKHIYHCDDCGICRVGRGLEKDFFHCKTCRACISIATKDDHKCIERATDATCPICNDDMFSSPQQVIFMECGHPIHRNCFQQYMNTSYKCPLCSKSIVKMDALFLNLANIIKEQPMPEEYRGVRSVLFCNDCSAKSSTDYHFLGLRCQICQSFNTVELDRSPMPAERNEGQRGAAAAEPSEHGTAHHAGQNRDVTTTSSSPLHSPGFGATSSNAVLPSVESPGRHAPFAELDLNLDDDEEEDDEELDFWGRNPRRQISDDEGESEYEGEEDSEVDEEDEDEDDEDEDNDEMEEINLFGHR